MRILVTGGAGFVGGNIAVGLRLRHPHWTVVAFDNLHRRGSELQLVRLREAGWIEGTVEGTAVNYCLHDDNIAWFREKVGSIF